MRSSVQSGGHVDSALEGDDSGQHPRAGAAAATAVWLGAAGLVTQFVNWLILLPIIGGGEAAILLMGVALGVTFSIAAIVVGAVRWRHGRMARLGVLLGVVGVVANPVSLYLVSLVINGTGDLRR